MQINDDIIVSLSPKHLLSKQTFDSLYSIDDELERARMTALLSAKAKELKIEKEFVGVIKAYDKASKKLLKEYAKQEMKRTSAFSLKYTDKGKVANTIQNYLAIIKNDYHFDSLKFNLLTYSPERIVDFETVRWTDSDDSFTRQYIESEYGIHSQSKLDDALRIVFKEREYHPIKNIIDNTKWDGVNRIETLLIKWLKCEDTPYTREVSRLIFAGGIHRLYNAGCKFDEVPVLIGTKQGEGKSTFVRWLALKDDFFTEVCEFDGQKGIESIEGAWICEIAELLALTKLREVEAVKAYLTKVCDKYRRPFDKRVSEHKRQCVFIGTTNKEQFLTDKTGNRRFYPVKVYQNGYDLFDNKAEIQADILQCWAEAKARMDDGKMPAYANKKLVDCIRAEQQNAVEDDYREGLILGYLSDKKEICILDIWKNAFGNEFSKPSKKDSNEIALILQGLDDWEKQNNPKRIHGYGLQKWWARVPNGNNDTDDLPFN